MNEIKHFWEEWREMKSSVEDVGEWWDKGKKKIKQMFTDHGIKKAKERKVTKKELTEVLERLFREKNQNFSQINKIKDKLND